MESAYTRWRELHKGREPMSVHDPLCVWLEGDPVGCLGCDLVELRSEMKYATGDVQDLARAALYEMHEVVRGHLLSVSRA